MSHPQTRAGSPGGHHPRDIVGTGAHPRARVRLERAGRLGIPNGRLSRRTRAALGGDPVSTSTAPDKTQPAAFTNEQHSRDGSGGAPRLLLSDKGSQANPGRDARAATNAGLDREGGTGLAVRQHRARRRARVCRRCAARLAAISRGDPVECPSSGCRSDPANLWVPTPTSLVAALRRLATPGLPVPNAIFLPTWRG